MGKERIRELAAFAPAPVVHALYQRVIAGDPLDVPIHPHADRLVAAILFADISGFTALTEALTRHSSNGAEELTRLLNLYFTRMILQVESYGGLVIRLSGDAILALFRTDEQTSLAEAMLRAMYAAVDMQAAMVDFQNLHTSVGPASLAMKIGIGAGDTFVSHVGGVFNRWEYLVAGDSMEQAANAENQARPGMVILAPEAARLVAMEHYDVPECVTVLDEAQGTHEEKQKAMGREAQPIYPVPSRIVPPRYAWDNVPPERLEAAEKVLHSYVPAAITRRLAAGQQAWLADLRRMSAMFVGVGGLDYNDTHAMEKLQAFLSATQTIIYRYEGSLNKIAVDDKGTVLLILFGAPPLAHEDDPMRTMACAHELQQLVSNNEPVAGNQGGAPGGDVGTRLNLNLAIGITTDTVFAGPVGSPDCWEYTVMGDTVNLASRLMQAAGAGVTYCDHTTYNEVMKHWIFEPLPPLLVKGKSQAVRVYKFSGTRAVAFAHETRPLVGRDSELTVLMNYLQQVEQGSGCMVSLVGEGGMGKTRLLQEFIELAKREHTVAPPLLGTANSIGQQTPYLVWREVFLDYFDLDQVLDAEQREQRIHQQVYDLDPALEQRLPLLNDILELDIPDTPVTRGLGPRQHRDSLTFLVVQLLLARASAQAVLIVLDDMHWSDSLSWELALDVARATALRPVMIILSYRPPQSEQRSWLKEREEVFHTITGLNHHHDLRLHPLETEAIAQLAKSHMDGKPVAPDVVDWLTERSEGNAFFVEETMRMLRDESALVLDDQGIWQLRNKALTAIPATLKSVIQSHLDRLQPGIQLTCKVASVVGRVFPARVVAGIYPMQDEQPDVVQHFDILAQQNITPLESHEPELRYQFKSALTQDVVYSSLLMAHRQELHEAVAEWYQREYAANLDPYIPLLADHYRYTEKWHLFLDFAERAGKIAAKKYANAEAINYLSQAIDLLHSRPDLLPAHEQQERLFALLLQREQVYRHNSEIASQADDLQHLHDLAEALDNLHHRALVQIRWTQYHQSTNNYDAANQSARTAIKIAKQLGDYQLLGEAMNLLARNAELRADYQQALWWGLQAMDYCREVGDQQGLAHSLNFLGIAHAELGDYTQAEAYHQQALTLRRDIGDQWGEATSLNQLGNLQSNLGKPRQALEYYHQALTIRRGVGDRSGEAFSLLKIGDAYQSLGDLSMAQKYQQETLTILRELGNQYGEAMLLISMCDTATALGNFEQAQQYVEEGIHLARDLGNRQIEALCLTKWGNAGRDLAALRRRELRQDQTMDERRFVDSTEDLSLQPFSDDRRLPLMTYEYHSAAHKLAQELGLRRLEAYTLHHLGEWTWEWGGDDEQSRARQAAMYWETAAAIRQEIGELDFAHASRIRQSHALLYLNDTDQSRALVEEVWKAWGTNPPSGEDENELREGYLSLYYVWQALGQPERATTALAWAYQAVQDRAVCISDPLLRQSFLERVSINRAIIRAWDALVNDDESAPAG